MATAAQRHPALRDYDNLRDPRDGDDIDRYRARYRPKNTFWNPRDEHLTIPGYTYLITQRVLPATFSAQELAEKTRRIYTPRSVNAVATIREEKLTMGQRLLRVGNQEIMHDYTLSPPRLH